MTKRALYILMVVVLLGCSGADRDSLFFKAEELLSHGRYEDALEHYARFVDLYPESEFAPKSQYMIGYILSHHLARPDEAMDSYAMVVNLYPESPYTVKAREDMARLYSLRGDHRAAITQYDWLIKNGAKEKRPEYRYSTALEYIKMNEFKQARVELEELLKDDASPDMTPRILYQIANTYYLEGSLEKAISVYDRIIEEHKEHPVYIEARLGKASVLEKQGSLREALGLLTELEREYPDSDTVKIRINSTRKRLKKAPGFSR